ncbi:MAG: UDP-N-acetylmuramoyl-L-alanine--D-glutamate ligase [Gemmatimonadales bacterium]|nr:UDP-N-acetylmuramoyl-L-alanine--D-glutamate ligase [Gemmatimonadales bacterium]
MLEALRAHGREVAVVGLASSGVAATHLLREHGLAVYASDAGQGEALATRAAGLRAAGADVQLGGHDLARLARAQLVVLSPGVPPDAPPYAAAAAAGVPIVSEVDLGFTALRGTRVVGLTGTNGKTTTTSLVRDVLRAMGHADAVAAGNIGLPLAEVARAAAHPSWVALELSSFQLHDCPHVAPDVGVLTNLAPNHLDRYPTLDAYYADKRLLFRHATAASRWVTNADNADSVALVAGIPGRHLRFSTTTRADGWYDRARRLLMLDDAPLLERDRLPLLGDHNVENALAAALVGAHLGATPAAIVDALVHFVPIAHRVEPLREVDGVLWVNDSKSTNVTSTEVAVAALDRPFVLLLGGKHKGEPYTRLLPRLAGRCRAVVAYGEAAPLIRADLGTGLDVRDGGTRFADVVALARDLARAGDAVLLSPACSSFDMFTGYEQRGEAFRALVAGL